MVKILDTKIAVARSIRDTLQIIERCPPNWGEMIETLVVDQISKRATIIHTDLERGLKAIIGNDDKLGHKVNELFRILGERDKPSQSLLSSVFETYVGFHRVDTARFPHFHSIKAYLEEVGKDTDFEAMRYWLLESNNDERMDRIKQVYWLELMAELLRGLKSLLEGRRPMTVLERVEFACQEAVGPTLWHTREQEDLWRRYTTWLESCGPRRDAIAAFVQGKCDQDEPYINERMQMALSILERNHDPEVHYFLQSLNAYQAGINAVDHHAEVDWVGGSMQWRQLNRGTIRYKGREMYACIQERIDQFWEARVDWGFDKVPHYRLCNTKDDAIGFVLRHCTCDCRIVKNGLAVNADILTDVSEVNSSLDANWVTDVRYEFLTEGHGVENGDHVRIVWQDRFALEGSIWEEHVGTVVSAEPFTVTVRGSSVFRPKDDILQEIRALATDS